MSHCPARGLFAAVTVALVVAAGCEAPPPGPKLSRFNAAQKNDGAQMKASTSFCEAVYPRGEGGKPFVLPAERPLPGQAAVAPPTSTKTWRWVNLWATWCRPCVEELGLLNTWQKALGADGMPIAVELYSVDDGEEDLARWLKKGPMPGTVRWLKGGAADLPAVLEGLGVVPTSPIPVHALVDGDNHLRCVRVGSVHQEDYAAIKAIIAGG